MANLFVDYNDSETKLNDSLALCMTRTKRTVTFTLISENVEIKCVTIYKYYMCELQNYGEHLLRTERLTEIISNVITSFVLMTQTYRRKYCHSLAISRRNSNFWNFSSTIAFHCVRRREIFGQNISESLNCVECKEFTVEMWCYAEAHTLSKSLKDNPQSV